jgi:DNA-binding MarR family transcriptional regulator
VALVVLSPIHRATRQIALYLESRTANLGVSNAEGHLVSYLRSYGPASMGELHRVFGFKRSTLTGLVDRLEEGGLAVRDLDPGDRRSFQVSLTREGRRVGDRLQAVLEEFEWAVSARVTRSERAGFEAVLGAIAEVTGVEVRPGGRGS